MAPAWGWPLTTSGSGHLSPCHYNGGFEATGSSAVCPRGRGLPGPPLLAGLCLTPFVPRRLNSETDLGAAWRILVTAPVWHLGR